ncbi:hypothetical protein NCTGTJJY_CDS0002 [Serratia phage 92A1]|nr:hypothetical protein NCTGTJJY_CDS0002 [Serratia phage 92A1]
MTKSELDKAFAGLNGDHTRILRKFLDYDDEDIRQAEFELTEMYSRIGPALTREDYNTICAVFSFCGTPIKMTYDEMRNLK